MSWIIAIHYFFTFLKMNQKIKNRINILKSNGKKKNKDYFLTDEGNLIIRKRGFNEVVRAI